MDGFHERFADQSVTVVTIRFVGAVGAERSPLPADETVGPLKSSTAVNAKAAVKMINRENCRVVIMGLLIQTNSFSD